VFLVLLSPPAIASNRVKEECSKACQLAQRDPMRLILPVIVEPPNEQNIWPWLQRYRRIETPNLRPAPQKERIQRTLHALAVKPAKGAQKPAESADDLLLQGRGLFAQN
jgi:hypothetical protein